MYDSKNISLQKPCIFYLNYATNSNIKLLIAFENNTLFKIQYLIYIIPSTNTPHLKPPIRVRENILSFYFISHHLQTYKNQYQIQNQQITGLLLLLLQCVSPLTPFIVNRWRNHQPGDFSMGDIDMQHHICWEMEVFPRTTQLKLLNENSYCWVSFVKQGQQTSSFFYRFLF